MSKGLLFWILVLIWLLFGSWNGYSAGVGFVYVGMSILPWLCSLLLGWQVFGSPIQ